MKFEDGFITSSEPLLLVRLQGCAPMTFLAQPQRPLASAGELITPFSLGYVKASNLHVLSLSAELGLELECERLETPEAQAGPRIAETKLLPAVPGHDRGDRVRESRLD